MLIICYLPLLSMGTIATSATQQRKELDLCGMLHLSTYEYDHAVCVNATVQVNVLDCSVAVRQHTAMYCAVRSVNGA